jgi:hypothetical protein
MEPPWNVSKLQIVFGNHKVTPSLMVSLGIQETCLLRGDWYHNTNESFPKKFGKHFFVIIKPYLKVMMESKTEEKWSYIYGQAAKQCLCFRPDKVELLGGWSLCKSKLLFWIHLLFDYPGSLDMKGYIAVKDSHYYVAAYLADGAVSSTVL